MHEQLTLRQTLSRLEDVVIQAHYVAGKIQELCVPSGIGSPEASEAAAAALRRWAEGFSGQVAEVRAAIMPAVRAQTPSRAPPRRGGSRGGRL